MLWVAISTVGKVRKEIILCMPSAIFSDHEKHFGSLMVLDKARRKKGTEEKHLGFLPLIYT